jgi:hypothetical protein
MNEWEVALAKDDKYNEEPGYYAIVPAPVRYDKSLPSGAKLLYGEITALCNKEGYCWASNSYFSKLYRVSVKTISRWIAILEKQNYIKSKIHKKKANLRHLKLVTMDKIVYSQKSPDLSPKMSIPMDKNVPSYKGINNTINNTINNKEKIEKIAKTVVYNPYTKDQKKLKDAG